MPIQHHWFEVKQRCASMDTKPYPTFVSEAKPAFWPSLGIRSTSVAYLDFPASEWHGATGEWFCSACKRGRASLICSEWMGAGVTCVQASSRKDCQAADVLN